MNMSRLAFTFCFALACWLSANMTFAEDAARFEKGIAVVDVTRFFKQCDFFAEEMAKLRDEVSEFGEQMKDHARRMKDFKEERNGVTTDSAEYESLSIEIASVHESGNVEFARRKAEFLRRETDLYARVYKVMLEEIAAVAREKKITLVVRHRTQPMDRFNRDDVLKHLSKDVLFQDDIDITPDVIERVNVRLPGPAS